MVYRLQHPPHRLDTASAVPLTRARLAIAGVLGGAVAVVWLMTLADEPVQLTDPVVLPATSQGTSSPQPVATSPATLGATLRASETPPSPDLLRDNPQAQAAYDASAKPGDFVTPPSVSVEH